MKSLQQEFLDKFDEGSFNKDLKDLDVASMVKLVYYRWYLYKPSLLVIAKPFNGMDVALRKLTTRLIYDITKLGTAVIVVSSNYSEAYSIGERMLKIY
jgi:ABC-type sugar transport system ATPase subunit